MPKRTNDFQSLIAFIEAELAPAGMRVTESAELREAEGETPREVDVLLETEVNGHPIEVAIECRDHVRPQTKGWIDDLIGKYRDLKVNQIVAVSRSGFTQDAKLKAERVGIHALTFEEAFEVDWPAEFIRIYIRFLSQSQTLRGAKLLFKSNLSAPIPEDVFRHCQITTGDGRLIGTVESESQGLFEFDKDNIIKDYCKGLTAADFEEWHNAVDGKTVEVVVQYKATDRLLVTPDCDRIEIDEIHLLDEIRLRAINASSEHYIYNTSQVTFGSLEVDEGRLSVAVVQFPREQDKFKLAYTKLEPRRA